METKINGEELPYVVCKLNKGESVVTENGGMSWMDDGISMKTTTNGGIMKGLGRALAGESIFMNVYTAEKDDVEIAFASSFPGQILEFDLKEGETIIAQKRAFLCAEPTVDISMHFRKRIGAGFFGGKLWDARPGRRAEIPETVYGLSGTPGTGTGAEMEKSAVCDGMPGTAGASVGTGRSVRDVFPEKHRRSGRNFPMAGRKNTDSDCGGNGSRDTGEKNTPGRSTRGGPGGGSRSGAAV